MKNLLISAAFLFLIVSNSSYPQEDKKIKAGLEEPKGHDIEEGDYKVFFQKAMKKFGISSPDELEDDKKKL